MVFLTGDLGFMALEPLQKAMGSRFINAGVSEQNMVSVSAALAKQGFDVWAYSIAPFCYARPFEQIRNDITFHDLPVTLVGNGGGFGYGVMGPTHHAIEDYGVLLTLDNMAAFIPTFDEDIEHVVRMAGDRKHPSYLRLGRGEPPANFDVPAYSPWRLLLEGQGPIVVVVGPLAGTFIAPFRELSIDERPTMWALSELPIALHALPERLLSAIAGGAAICVIEEHVAHGSAGGALALYFATNGIPLRRFRHLAARAHVYSRYGSQSFMRKLSGLDPGSAVEAIRSVSAVVT